MKRPIAVSLLAVAVCATGFWSCIHPTELPSLEVLFGQHNNAPVITELGIPSQQTFAESSVNSRNPWDMALFNGKLYIGSGDYGENTGPCDVWQYDPEAGEWTNSGTVNDEAIANFETVNGQLIITGTDPKNSWEHGSFYTLTADGWQTDRSVPYGVHMFDIALFQNKTFYGIGNANNAQSPVQMTADGKAYINVPFYIGDEALLNNPNYGYSRCYNLFEIDNELYAFCFISRADGDNIYGFYKFDGNAFRLVSQISDLKLERSKSNRQLPFNKALTLNGRFYFSTGILYTTEDFIKVEKIAIPDDEYVQDMTVENGKMYVLTSKELEKTVLDENGASQSNVVYNNTVWEYDKTKGLTKIYSFEYGLSAMSFEKYKNTYYFGIGQRTELKELPEDSPLWLNGTIIKVEF